MKLIELPIPEAMKKIPDFFPSRAFQYGKIKIIYTPLEIHEDGKYRHLSISVFGGDKPTMDQFKSVLRFFDQFSGTETIECNYSPSGRVLNGYQKYKLDS